MKDNIIGYVEGSLPDSVSNRVKNMIQNDEVWKAEYEKVMQLNSLLDNLAKEEPPSSLRRDFDRMLKMEMATEETKSGRNKTWLYVAASVAILVAGYFLGTYSEQASHTDELQSMKEEISANRALISSLQNTSASARIKAVSVSSEMTTLDNEVTDALVNTLNTDENTNVRLAALDALSLFAHQENVKNALIKSLSTQDRPAVQIILINLLVSLKEKRAIEPLQQLIENETNLDAVRDEANYGVFKLS